MYIFEYLRQLKEEMPKWLLDYKPGEKLNIDDVLNSRSLYYPGSGHDGTPLRILNQSHAVHLFIYSDYQYKKEETEKRLQEEGAFLGYHLIGEQEVSEEELTPYLVTYHSSRKVIKQAQDFYRNNNLVNKEGYCLLKIYERDENYDDNHGAKRFAFMYICGDSYATYDALFGNGHHRVPFCLEVSNYGFGNEYGAFDASGPFNEILEKTNAYPEFLLESIYSQTFKGYEMVKDVQASSGGVHGFRNLLKHSKKTLVIHPNDKTTEMLIPIYKGKKDWTICRDEGITKNELRRLINEHDRIVMLGHGSPAGLINGSRTGFLIDDTFADLLKQKECISVWCYSDEYFRKHNIKGFHTGMIISETMEEYMMLGSVPLSEEEIYQNMIKFSKVIAECIDETPEKMKEYILENYIGDNPVTTFNRNNIIVI